MRHNLKQHNQEKGFTIIELMIATAVLSVMLLLLTVTMINIGKLYYKGINQTRVQGSVRTVVDDISQQLKLKGNLRTSTPTTVTINGVDISAYCIGNTRYSYVLGRQIGTGNDINADNTTTPQVAHILWKDTNTSGGCQPLNLTQSSPDPTETAGPANSLDGSELIPPGSRLTNFSIEGVPPNDNSPYIVSIEVAYGNSDLLNNRTGPPGSVVCIGGQGNEFCATASLITTVTSRL